MDCIRLKNSVGGIEMSYTSLFTKQFIISGTYRVDEIIIPPCALRWFSSFSLLNILVQNCLYTATRTRFNSGGNNIQSTQN